MALVAMKPLDEKMRYPIIDGARVPAKERLLKLKRCNVEK